MALKISCGALAEMAFMSPASNSCIDKARHDLVERFSTLIHCQDVPVKPTVKQG